MSEREGQWSALMRAARAGDEAAYRRQNVPMSTWTKGAHSSPCRHGGGAGRGGASIVDDSDRVLSTGSMLDSRVTDRAAGTG